MLQHRLLSAGEGLGHVLHDKSILGGHGVAEFLLGSGVARQLVEPVADFYPAVIARSQRRRGNPTLRHWIASLRSQ
jgi:hypothetical protein